MWIRSSSVSCQALYVASAAGTVAAFHEPSQPCLPLHAWCAACRAMQRCPAKSAAKSWPSAKTPTTRCEQGPEMTSSKSSQSSRLLVRGAIVATSDHNTQQASSAAAVEVDTSSRALCGSRLPGADGGLVESDSSAAPALVKAACCAVQFVLLPTSSISPSTNACLQLWK
jgi:hypothetical protein